MSRKFVLILLGGALSSFFVVPFLFASFSSNYKNEHPVNLSLANLFGTKTANAYDQHNTHPALTDEAVDFYNLNFPKNKITEKEKQLLIKGAVEEDFLPRPMNHFYDPVYKKGWAGYRSSKLWARSSAEQQTGKGLLALNPFVTDKFSDSWPSDFSYERALLDYAKGDRERAFEAFGHVMHLLEDANVPEHTRNDTHVDVGHGTGSPYEHDMAKWNPSNFNIVGKLFNNGEKPVLFNSLDNYFDAIAGYSNGNFFSQDTIESSKYNNPKIIKFKRFGLPNNRSAFIGIGLDKNGKEFDLVFTGGTKTQRNVVESRESTLINNEIGTKILDGYWSRLSKDFVLHGAGALKMFLEQAEEVKKEYEKEVAAKKENKSWLASIFGREPGGIEVIKDILAEGEKKESRFDLFSDSRSNLATERADSRSGLIAEKTEIRPPLRSEVESLKIKPQKEEAKVEPSQAKVQPLLEENVGGGKPVPTPKSEPLEDPSPVKTSEDEQGSTLVKPKININTAGKEELMALKGIGDVKSGAIVEYRQTRGLFEKIENIMDVKGIGEATFNDIRDFITTGEITFSGSGGTQTAASTPSPTPTPVSTPEATPTPSTTPTPTPDSAIRKVVINEIAWMGTNASANDEWIELYNTSSKSVELTGWTLQAQDGTPDISLSPISIGPFGFYLLERTSDSTISDTSASQIYTGALSNTGENLELRDAAGNLQDLVSKPTSGDWYAGNNTSKSSMERINPKTRGDEPLNWGTNNGTTKNGLDAGGAALNGTPKSKNSNYISQKPSKVTNLALSGSTNLNNIYLTWSVPSDPDTASASLSYDLRYATKSFDTADDWTNAIQGSTLYVDNFSTAIQDFNKTYYFALKTKDTDNNYSDISNQISHAIGSAISSSGWPMSGLNQSHTLKASFLGPTSSATTAKWAVQFWSSPPSNFGQPVVGPNGRVYFGTSNGAVSQLWARSSANAEVWTYSGTDGATIGTPAVLADNSIIFGYSSFGTNLTKLDANKTIQFENNIGQITAITVGSDGTSYFTSSADKILAVKPDGTQKWLTYKDGIAGYAPVILDDGRLYLTSRLSGTPNFYAFDSETGAFLWSKTMSNNSPSCCGVSDISYDSTSDYLYAGADQYILKVDRNGNNLEQFAADRQVGWGYTTTMISQDTGNLIFGLDFSINNPASKSAVYAVNKITKEVAWKYAVDSKVNKQIAIDSGGNSYFSTKNGVVYSLNQNGVLNWKYDFGPATISTYPVIAEGVLYVSIDDARLVKFGE